MSDIEEQKTEIQKEEKTTEQLLATQKEQYLLILADYENRMKRIKQDSINAINLAVEGLVVDLAPLMQDLNKAINAVEAQHKNGIELIKKNMNTILKKYGVEEIMPAILSDFDPHLHQALSVYEKADVAEGKILEILQIGYQLNKKVIVPATVIVSK